MFWGFHVTERNLTTMNIFILLKFWFNFALLRKSLACRLLLHDSMYHPASCELYFLPSSTDCMLCLIISFCETSGNYVH
jgi:hypothetical protein